MSGKWWNPPQVPEALNTAKAKVFASNCVWDGKGDRPEVALAPDEYDAVHAAISESSAIMHFDSEARLLFLGWPVVTEPA